MMEYRLQTLRLDGKHFLKSERDNDKFEFYLFICKPSENFPRYKSDCPSEIALRTRTNISSSDDLGLIRKELISHVGERRQKEGGKAVEISSVPDATTSCISGS